RLLICDEATEGLAPLVRSEIWRCLKHLKARGQSILLIDKDLAALTRVADAHYILEKGQIVWSGTSAELRAREDIHHRYLGVGETDGRELDRSDVPEDGDGVRAGRPRARAQPGHDDGARDEHVPRRPPRPDPHRHRCGRGRLRAAPRALPRRAQLPAAGPGDSHAPPPRPHGWRGPAPRAVPRAPGREDDPQGRWALRADRGPP